LAITTESLLHGPTRNPWNCNYSTGGSSGGSAALVASGVVPIAHGNDGGGSIRIPAACCGLVGLKPTRGRLKMDPKYKLLLVKVICPGVLTRTVRDTATFYAEAEKYYCNERLPKIGLVDRPSKKRLTIGIISEGPHNTRCHPELYDLAFKTGALCEQLGHTVKEVKYPFISDIIDDLLIYWGMIAFSFCSFGKLTIGSSPNCKNIESWTSGLNMLFKKNIARIPGIIMRLRGFEETYNSAFRNCDILLSPTLSNPTPELGYLSPEVPFEVVFERVKKYVTFTLQQNISGAPAISLPLGIDSKGLPMGIQFASASGREKMLLELAFELEEANPWPPGTGLLKKLF
jgi:amidase